MLTRKAYHVDLKWKAELNLSALSPAYTTPHGALVPIDAIELLRKLPSNSIDLVMTSPPFALTRQKEYGNQPVKSHLQWFMPFCRQIHRVLKRTVSVSKLQ